jgi:hypothetical protein
MQMLPHLSHGGQERLNPRMRSACHFREINNPISAAVRALTNNLFSLFS